MRFLPLIAASTAALVACKPNCGSPNQLDGVPYDMFGNVIAWDLSSGQTAPPGMTPVNGSTDWEMTWGPSPAGPVSITIDEQTFEGEGIWQERECGNFRLSFGGSFVSGEGTTHNFTAAGNYLFYDTLLEGAMAWSETWTTGNEVGAFSVTDAAVSGRQQTP